MTTTVALLVEHWRRYPKGMGSVPTDGWCIHFFSTLIPFHLCRSYLADKTNNFPYGFHSVVSGTASDTEHAEGWLEEGHADTDAEWKPEGVLLFICFA